MWHLKFENTILLKIFLAVILCSLIILFSATNVSARKRYGSGSQNPKPTPTVTPRPPRCGNNQCDPGETCDGVVYCVVGGAIRERSCRDSNSDARCSFCGDGMVQRYAGEECDDGNSVNDDRCSNYCRINQVQSITTVASTPTPTPAPTRRPTLVRTGISLVVPFTLGLFSLGAVYVINRKRD